MEHRYTSFSRRTTTIYPSNSIRPRNLILDGKTLIEVSRHPSGATLPYIAVSYTWDSNPEYEKWCGRKVTRQALDIVAQLSIHTPLALWIDAICIDQDDTAAKNSELPKMADIYRNAVGVVCLVSSITEKTGPIVRQGAAMVKHAASHALAQAGDRYGRFMFATLGAHSAVEALFAYR